MNIIDGKKIAAEIIGRLKKMSNPGHLDKLVASKFFGAVLVGNDPASLNFLKQKEKTAKELGVEFRLYQLPSDIKTDELRREIRRLSSPKNCGGFIVQLPLPESINKQYVLNAIPKEKDADLLGEAALGVFYSGRSKIIPPSVGTVDEILSRENSNLRQLKVVVMGSGFLIGKPVGFWLQNKVAELTVVDSKSPELREKLKNADVIISGAGQANLFSAKDLKSEALVIDFGFNPSTSSRPSQGYGGQAGQTPSTASTSSPQASTGLIKKVVGDFDPDGAEEKNIKYTKTPGGTGPILVAKLFENFYKLCGNNK